MNAQPKDVTDAVAAGVGIDPETAAANIKPVETSEPTAAEAFLGAIRSSALSTDSLMALDLQPKEKLLGDFFEEADFGLLGAALMRHAVVKTGPFKHLRLAGHSGEGRSLGEASQRA